MCFFAPYLNIFEWINFLTTLTLLLEMKNLGHSEKNIFNKHFQGANSELKILYIFQGKHPEFRRMAEFRKSSECYDPSFSSSNSRLFGIWSRSAARYVGVMAPDSPPEPHPSSGSPKYTPIALTLCNRFGVNYHPHRNYYRPDFCFGQLIKIM